MTTKKALLKRKVELNTAISLSQTRPAKLSKIASLQRRDHPPVVAHEPKKKIAPPETLKRQQPPSQIARLEKTLFWFIPARLSYSLFGIYALAGGLYSILFILSGFGLAESFLTFPFEQTFANLVLAEAIATLAFLAATLCFYAVAKPYKFKLLFYALLLVILPTIFISDLARLQLETPIIFEYYLYFDIIVVSLLWALLLFSLPAFLEYPGLLKKIKHSIK